MKNDSGEASDGNDYFVFNTTTRTLHFDKDGNGAEAAVKLAIFGNKAVLFRKDILVA